MSTRVLDLSDPSRSTDPTPEQRGLDARPGRDLPTTLWYPRTGEGPFPLVVFSHGTDASPEGYEELLEAWAAAGFVVAAPTFPLTSAGTAVIEEDIANQPADVSFVLTEVLALGTTDGDPLERRIDRRHVAAAGHSAGAATTSALLFSCCLDERVTAEVVLAGGTGGYPTDFADVDVPTLYVHGTDDEGMSIDDARALYEAQPGRKAFVELPGGSHTDPYSRTSDPYAAAVRAVTTDFLRWTLDGDRAALAEFVIDAGRPGVAELRQNALSG
ncbi:alpha/beta hydrolase family protein [Geodermatophilus normandii]|uniref:alpha/beta hydrolase family protein n=1 Tax=Geodermatophilus normandii TaxID=1137989 RepID=UPI001474E108|nr:alpha/beta hydrolase [Geodermatophilus normandii]